MDNKEPNCLLDRIEEMRTMRTKLSELLVTNKNDIVADPEQILTNLAGLHDVWQADEPVGAGLITVLNNVAKQLGPVGALMMSKMFTSMLLRCLLHDLKALDESGRTGELDYLMTEQGVREQTAVVRAAVEKAGGPPWEKPDLEF